MLDAIDGQVDIDLRPMKMIRARTLDLKYGSTGRPLEPRKFVEWETVLLLVTEYPKAMLRDIRDLNFRSGCSRHLESPVHVPV